MSAPVTPAQAKAILDALPRKTLAALRRELVRRGQPVSVPTLRKWRANSWTRKSGAAKSSVVSQARKAATKVGLPADVIRDLEIRLEGMSDGELLVDVTRRLLINAALVMEHAKHMAPQLMREDLRGLAALYMAAYQMTVGSHDLMREARNTAERAMKERSLLLLPPADDARAKKDGAPPAGPSPFAALIERFGGISAPSRGSPIGAADGEIIPLSRSVNREGTRHDTAGDRIGHLGSNA